MSNVNHLTGGQIKALYESQPDTNAYTDAEKAKLNDLESEISVDWDTQVTNKPDLGTAALADVLDFATAAQGTLAESALQTSDLAEYETSSQLDTRDSVNRDRSNHSGTQSISTITGLSDELEDINTALGYVESALGYKEDADSTILKEVDIGVTVMGYNPDIVIDPNYVATEENYTTLEKQKLAAIDLDELGNLDLIADWADITGKPAFGTAALANTGDFATAAQGSLAASALQASALANYETTTQLNARDTANRARSNHTGTQAISSVSGLQTTLDAKAPINSPTFTGTPAGPTAAGGTNNTQLATTAFVQSAVTNYETTTQLNARDTANKARANHTGTQAISTVTNLQSTLDAKAPINSPTFTGTPAGPTPSLTTNTTQFATTEFVQSKMAERYTRAATTVSALNIDCSLGNYYTKTISSNSTFTFSNAPSNGTVYAFTLELTHNSGTVTWPASVSWPGNTAPTLTNSKIHIFTFVTRNNGSKWFGSSSINYNQ
jgi:hypothetical protein